MGNQYLRSGKTAGNFAPREREEKDQKKNGERSEGKMGLKTLWHADVS